MNDENDHYKRHLNNYKYVDAQLNYIKLSLKKKKHVGTEFFLRTFIALCFIKRVCIS